MKGNMWIIKNKEEASTSWVMDQNMWVNLKMVIFMVWVDFTVQMAITMKDSTKMINGMGWVDIALKMGCLSSWGINMVNKSNDFG